MDNAVATILLKNLFSKVRDVTVITSPYDKVEEYVNNNLNGPYNYNMIVVVSDKICSEDKRVVFVTRKSIVRANKVTELKHESFTKSAIAFSKKMAFTFSRDLLKLALRCMQIYDSPIKRSPKLEILYNELGFMRFIDRFENGFDNFNDDDVNTLTTYTTELNNHFSCLDLYKGNHKGLNIRVAMSESYKFKRDIARKLIEGNEYDFGIVVNVKNKSLYIINSFKDECNSSIEIAQDFCDLHSGDDHAVGGKFNKTFLKFAETLEEIK